MMVDRNALQKAAEMAARHEARERLREQDERVRLILASAVAPAVCGDDIHAAPARGPLETFEPVGVVPDGEYGFRVVVGGYCGRSGARVRDVFDRMADRDDKKTKAIALTQAQVDTGRRYAYVTERYATASSSRSTLEPSQGCGDGGFIDAVLDDARWLQVMHRRIGSGFAKEIRRHRPSQTSVTRRALSDRQLVDAVCIGQLSPREVLRRYGWESAGGQIQARLVRDVTLSLARTLDRMAGDHLVRQQHVMHVGPCHTAPWAASGDDGS